MKIYLVHKLPTPYNDFLFRALHAAPDVQLQVYHLWRGSWRRPWQSVLGTGYPNIYMKLIAGVDWKVLWVAMRERNSLFLIADWGHVSALTIVCCRLLVGGPVSFWVDTPQEQLRRPFFKRAPRQWLLRFLLRRVDRVFATGEPARRALLGMGANGESIINLPFFVDLERPLLARLDAVLRTKTASLRRKVGCELSGIVFAMAGTIIIEKKGQDVALKAFAICCAKATRPVGMLIAGEGPDRAAMEALVHELGIANRVVFLGWQEPDEMEAVYLAADAVVHPSRYDPFPLIVIEAMNWGRPIIGSDACGSIQDRVVHQKNGFSFPSGDVSALAKIMIEAAEDPSRLTEVGRAGRQTAEKYPVMAGVETVKRALSDLVN